MKKVDRREALLKLAGLGAGVAALGLCTGCPGGSTYREQQDAQKSEGDGVTDVEKRKVRPYTAMAITVGGRPAFIFRGAEDKDEWYAVDARCTHSGCKVGFNAPQREFVCPCHGSKFSFDGTRISGPARRPLKTYAVVIGDNDVQVVPDRPREG